MLTVFEVYLAPGSDPDSLLGEETRRETQAQLMTVDEALAVGFSGVQKDPGGLEIRLIAVNSRDKSWIHRVLETNEAVARFKVHEDVDVNVG
jgi:hypothetical protein